MIRAPVPGLAPGVHRLEGAIGHYLARVRRLRAGDDFVAFDPATGVESDATVLSADHDILAVRLGATREGRIRSDASITWIQGLAKGDKCDAVVRDATELGATRFVVATTKRSVVKLDERRSAERQARWARIAQEAARQSGRSDAPIVDVPCAWIDALARVDPQTARFCLWERATGPLAPPLLEALDERAPIAFACGPEGGLEDAEAAAAAASGWVLASLGPFVLRTETVAAAVLGAVRIWTALNLA